MLEVNRSEMASPAASSFALLIRRPVDNRSIDVAKAPWVEFMALWAERDSTLVFTDMTMGHSFALQLKLKFGYCL